MHTTNILPDQLTPAIFAIKALNKSYKTNCASECLFTTNISLVCCLLATGNLPPLSLPWGYQECMGCLLGWTLVSRASLMDAHMSDRANQQKTFLIQSLTQIAHQHLSTKEEATSVIGLLSGYEETTCLSEPYLSPILEISKLKQIIKQVYTDPIEDIESNYCMSMCR